MGKITIPTLFITLGLTISANCQDLSIAYNVAVKDNTGKSNYEVFTMNMDGSNKKNITRHMDVAWTYKAYQKDLYLISDRDTCYRCYFLYKTDVHGSAMKRVSKLQLEDSWMDFSKDGKEAIVSGRIGKDIRNQLFLVNTTTGAFTQITHDTSAYFRDPAFSPDGKKIVVVHRPQKRDRTIKDELYLMDRASGKLTRLTQYPPEKMQEQIPGYTAGAPHWHPIENFITYISMRDGQHHIYAVSPNGESHWKLTQNTAAEGWHDWSPDGNWLVFDSSNEDDSQYHIMLMNWKTKALKQLTDTTHTYQQSPVFVRR